MSTFLIHVEDFVIVLLLQINIKMLPVLCYYNICVIFKICF